MPEYDLIPKAKVCEELNITPHTFYAYRRKYPRTFRTVRVGTRTYMRRETLQEFLRALEEEQANERRAAA